MIKRYCDGCGESCDESDHTSRIREIEVFLDKGKKLTIHIDLAFNGRWNGDDICIKCLIRALSFPNLNIKSLSKMK